MYDTFLCTIVTFIVLSSTDSRTSRLMIPRDIDDDADPDVDDEKPSHRGSDVQPANYSNVNKQLSTQYYVILNIHMNTAYTNEDHNSVLCDKELCEGTIKSFSCTRCEMHFTSMEELTSHCEKHKTVAIHKCHVCEKSFAKKGHFTRHLRIHSGERPFQCEVCNKRLTTKSHLTYHLRIHSGERPYQCDFCAKSFTQKSNLTNHLRIHSGERPYQCDVCDKRFTSKDSLTKHLLIHSGERPYQCDVCDKRFTIKSDLTRHLRMHVVSDHTSVKSAINILHKTNKLTTHLQIYNSERPF